MTTLPGVGTMRVRRTQPANEPDKQNPRCLGHRGFLCWALDDDLLSHGETPHYHRRCAVSLLSSGWSQVVPALYGRQANGLMLSVPWPALCSAHHTHQGVCGRHFARSFGSAINSSIHLVLLHELLTQTPMIRSSGSRLATPELSGVIWSSLTGH